MNDKDKEAFEEWYHIANVDITGSNKDDIKTTWQDACEYKQKELDQLEEQSKWLVSHIDWDNLNRKESDKAIKLFRKYFPDNF
jgi:hypothetical protein